MNPVGRVRIGNIAGPARKSPALGGAGLRRQKGAGGGLAGHFAPRSSQAILRGLVQHFGERATSSKPFSQSHSPVGTR
jgi:hypothetical protein